MKKAIFLFVAIIGSYLLSDAQKVMNSAKEVVGYITKEGVVLDSTYTTKGYFKDDGSILNDNYVTIGYIKTDGSIRTVAGKKLGSISPEGLIYNAKKNHVGTITKEGELQDAKGVVIATTKDVEAELAAVSIFFFFKLAGSDYYNSPPSTAAVSVPKSR